MASFLPGLSDQIGDVPLYQPDFTFLERMARRKDMMYEQGFSSVQKAYNKVLHTPLSNPQNISIREQYVRDAEKRLKDLSSVDLSLPENQMESQKIFAPFWQDQDLVADATRTKIMNDGIQQGYALLNSPDEKKRNQFWMTGIEYLNNGLKELQRARRGDGSIQKITPRRYIPSFDLMGFLKDRAGKDGIKIVQSTSSPSGYKITRTNGEDTHELFEVWVERQLQGNQAAMDVFRVQGTVNFENKVNTYLDAGLDPATAKDAVAKDYLRQQRSHYLQGLETVNTNIPKIKAQMDAIEKIMEEKYGGNVPTDADGLAKAQEFKTLQQKMKLHEEKQHELLNLVNDYGNPESDKYKGDYMTMINNGESYYAQKYRNDFIRGAAQALRIENSKLEYELDPGYKLNTEIGLEMTKLRQDLAIAQMKTAEDYYADDLRAAGRSGSGSSKTKTTQETLDTPIPMGLTVKGTDPITTQQRMANTMQQTADEFVANGTSILRNLSADTSSFRISDKFLTNLESAIKTGKFNGNDMEAINRELTGLFNAGIIPKDPRISWQNPSRIYSALTDYAANYYKTIGGSIRPEVLSKLINQDRIAKRFYDLKDVVTRAETEIQKDPELSPYFRNGRVLTEEQYLQEQFGASTEQEIKDKHTDYWIHPKTGRKMEQFSQQGLLALGEFRRAREEYRKGTKKTVTKMGNILQPYLEQEGAFIGQTVRLSTDQQGDTDRAQIIAQQVLNDANFRGQSVDRDGINPANISILESEGANKEDVSKILGMFRSNIKDYITAVDLTKIGIQGKPSVKLQLDMAKIRRDLGKDGAVSEGTLVAIGANGLEINVNDPKLIPELSEGFGSGVFDSKLFDENGSAAAPAFLKNIGFDYNIIRDNGAGQYLVSLQYPSYENGQITNRSKVLNIPINSSIREMESELLNKIYAIQQNNYMLQQRAQQLGGIFGNTAPTQPQGPVMKWSDFKNSQ